MTYKFSTIAAFVAIMIIWSTTPIAIKWSGEGGSFLFAVTLRMLIGLLLMTVITVAKRERIPLHKQALLTYLAAGLGIYLAMLSVYWAAQYIQSGYISVMFGLAPIITGVFAYWLLNDRDITWIKTFGVAFSIFGLAIIFLRNSSFGAESIYGLFGVLVSVSVHSLSAVYVKKLHSGLSTLSITCGGLYVAVFLYLLTWFIAGGQLPDSISNKALVSIIYLGVIATTLGFSLYFYIIKLIPATQVALLTLFTPVFALWIGMIFNNEVFGLYEVLGVICILLGMSFYIWGSKWLKKRS